MRSQGIFDFIDDLSNGGLDLAESNGRLEKVPEYIKYLQSLDQSAIVKTLIDILCEISKLDDNWKEDSKITKLELSIFDILDEIIEELTPYWELEKNK